MKKRLFIICSFVLLLFSLTSCVGKTTTTKPITPTPSTPVGPGTDPSQPEEPENPEEPTPGTDPKEELEFTVCLKNGDKLVTPTVEITVTWYNFNNNEQHSAKIGEDGYARVKGLDGEYGIHLSTTPAGTTYNPNQYLATNDQPNVEVQLTVYKTISNTAGTGLYGRKICSLDIGTVYRVNLDEQRPAIDVTNYKYRETQKGIKYFKFEAKFDENAREGTYVIESHVDLYDDNVNPYVITFGYFTGNYINTGKPVIQNDGGAARDGGYTKNFKFYVSYSKEASLGDNIYAFGLIAESKTKEYPITFDFSVNYYSDEVPDSSHTTAKIMYVTQETKDVFTKIGGKTPDNIAGTLVPNMAVAGVLSSSNVYYKEEDGFYHYRLGKTISDRDPILCAYITVPTPYVDKSFNHLEDEGPALTLAEGTEYYREYFYLGNPTVDSKGNPIILPDEELQKGIQYYTNSQGLCYVTKELKEVLQKVSIGQRYFMDGNGWIETTHNVYAAEQDQWLFACCYFMPE